MMQTHRSGMVPSILVVSPRAPLLTRLVPARQSSGRYFRIVPHAINKTELLESVQGECHGVPNNTVNQVVTTLLDTIVDNVATGEAVNITGFGKFERRCALVLHAQSAGRHTPWSSEHAS